MSETVLDSSVILAILRNERLDEQAYKLIDGGVMSAVNVAEVYARISDLHAVTTRDLDVLLGTLDRIEPFTASQARIAGYLRASTREAGLSLGDRCCLALALELDAAVYTTDQAWSRLALNCDIHLLR